MVTDLDIRRRCQCPGARYGLWSDTTEPGERLARLRALRALVRVFAGPAEAGVDAALSVAEIDPDLRVLTKKKSNYSAIGDEITLRWRTALSEHLTHPARMRLIGWTKPARRQDVRKLSLPPLPSSKPRTGR